MLGNYLFKVKFYICFSIDIISMISLRMENVIKVMNLFPRLCPITSWWKKASSYLIACLIMCE